MNRVDRLVEQVLRDRRPRRFEPSERETELIGAALELKAAREDEIVPRAAFVNGLHDRLARELAVPTDPVHTEPVRVRPVKPAGTRRRVVWAGGLAAVASAVAGVVAGRWWSDRDSEEEESQQSTVDSTANVWQPVLASTELPDGAVREFDVGTVAGFVARTEGSLHAVSAVCTHLGCRLVLDQGSRALACPCHPATFALDGSVVHYDLPIELRPLPRIEVREAGGDVQVFAPPKHV
jgi:cytochrome b6-f complex iron-sulfur subunit